MNKKDKVNILVASDLSVYLLTCYIANVETAKQSGVIVLFLKGGCVVNL